MQIRKIFLGIVFLLAGCADKNAFSKFDLRPDEELALDTAVYAKCVRNGKTYGVAAGVRLNDVYINHDYDMQTFYVVVFSQKKGLLSYMHFDLENENVTRLRKLPENNPYQHLLDYDMRWSSHYVAEFTSKRNDNRKNLRIVLANGATCLLRF